MAANSPNTGDENSASDMAAFCNEFDKICNETGCSVIYCHHHSKGAQGMKRAMDRASGSGVFARDPDAQLDMIELELGDQFQNWMMRPGVTGWRLEGSLREFPNFVPVNFWFEYPIHRLDMEQTLKKMPSQGSFEAGQMKSKYHKTTEMAEEEFRTAFQMLNTSGEGVPMQELMDYLQLAERTIRNRINKLPDEFCLEAGTVKNIDPKTPQSDALQTAPKSSKKTRSKNACETNDINVPT